MTTDASKTIGDAAGNGHRVIRSLVAINLALVAIQAVSAGFFLSGYQRAMTVHAAAAMALQAGALIQAATAFVLWRQRRVPAWMAGLSIGLFVMVLFQVGLGYRKQYWLHVPVGVAIFGWLTRHINRLEARWPTTEARS